MVNGVKSNASPIHIHQTLHGYDDGHRLIAGSISLKSRDAKTLLVLSDVSGPNAKFDQRGYITGYPLTGSGFYALARTWPAPEMPRPGCVWTHTVLIDFSDLALLKDPKELTSAFKRPLSGGDPAAFRSPVMLNLKSNKFSRNLISDAETLLLKAILNALYDTPDQPIFLSYDPKIDSESRILAIWSQQWPRLRRNFRFCTLTFADRSTESASFDLQVIPSNNRGKPAWSKSTGIRIDPGISEAPSLSNEWLDIALEDLSYEQPNGLRDFMRRAGADIKVGRRAFVPLCELYGALRRPSDVVSGLNKACRVIEKQFNRNEARVIRVTLLERLVERVQELKLHSLHFVLNHLDLFDPKELRISAARIGKAVWKSDRPAFFRLLDGNADQKVIAEQAIKKLPPKQLISCIRDIPNVLPHLFEIRPKLLEEPEIWGSSSDVAQVALHFLSAKPSAAAKVVQSMIISGNADLAKNVGHRIDPRFILPEVTKYLDKLNSEKLSPLEITWVEIAVRDPAVVAFHLASKVAKSKRSLLAIAHVTHPNFVPCLNEGEPWLIAVQFASGRLSKGGKIYLSAYLLARGLENSSSNPAELITFGFEDVYVALSESSMPDEAWNFLEQHLPSPLFWFHLSSRDRLLDAVTDAFVGRDLSPEAYAGLTEDDKLFERITRKMGNTYRSRRYLKIVQDALKTQKGKKGVNRYKIVTKALQQGMGS